MHLIDSVGNCKEIEYVCNLHEQACAIGADSYGQYTNNLGVALVTTGPGGTNATTGVAAAWGAAVEKDEDTWWVTIRLMCDFLSGASMGSFVEGKGHVIGRQDDVFTVEGKIWAGDKLLMRGTGIFKVIERREGQQKPFTRQEQNA